LHLLPGDLDRSIETIELTCVAEQGSLAVGPDVSDDLRDALLGLAVAIALRPEQRPYFRTGQSSAPTATVSLASTILIMVLRPVRKDRPYKLPTTS
jgi:hypothetical protein